MNISQQRSNVRPHSESYEVRRLTIPHDDRCIDHMLYIPLFSRTGLHRLRYVLFNHTDFTNTFYRTAHTGAVILRLSADSSRLATKLRWRWRPQTLKSSSEQCRPSFTNYLFHRMLAARSLAHTFGAETVRGGVWRHKTPGQR